MNKTKTQTIYLLARCREGASKISYSASDLDMSTLDEYTVIDQKEITFDLPDESTFLPVVIAGLEKKRDAMRATASAAIGEVENQIQSLLAIPNLQ